ncbi:MAG: formate dehydrogenase accessory sulfurtransferase FdhD [Deltaproteobacteria bacterium]|nr:MAG: formate dehydrogenase accessory sulfurtransferase FdhD [Deltaproteobacteria bacterium]
MYSSIRSFTYSKGKISSTSSHLILETPLEIIINGETSTLIMFTPGMTRELVTGFIFTEGFIDKISDIRECTISSVGKEDEEEVIEARVTIPSIGSIMPTTKSTRTSYSSCGICGKDNYYDLKRGLGRVKSKHRFSMEVLGRWPVTMEQYQPLYKKTGGAHAAVLLDSTGNPIICSEDMGRHNAVDKVIGAALMQERSFQDKIIVSSGRASLEMILKTARAGIPVFVAMSRPTSRAVEAAKFYNITLLDMAKDSNRIYSHVRRIEGF